jgi:hypothetical protein
VLGPVSALRGGPVAVVIGFDHLSYYLQRAGPWAMSSAAHFQRHANDDQLAGVVMSVDDQRPGSPSGQQRVKSPRGRFAFELCD